MKVYERATAWAPGYVPGKRVPERQPDTTPNEHSGGQPAEADAKRQLWREHTAAEREQADTAAAELARRSHPQPDTGTGPDRLPDPDPAAERDAITRQAAETTERERYTREWINQQQTGKQQGRHGLDPDLFRPRSRFARRQPMLRAKPTPSLSRCSSPTPGQHTRAPPNPWHRP